MALSGWTRVKNGKYLGFEGEHGICIAVCEFTSSDDADYSSGYDLDGNKSHLGFRAIHGVLAASLRASNGTMVAKGEYDTNSGKLRMFALDDALEVGAADLNTGDVVNCIILGTS